MSGSGPDRAAEAAGRPWLILDVDGVVSPVAESSAWPDFRPVPGAPYWLRLSRSMGDALAALSARRLWLTTWDGAANDWVAPGLGWSPLPVIDRPRSPGDPPGRAKLAGLRERLAAADRPPSLVVWCEDWLARPAFRAAAERLLQGRAHRLVAPEPRTGLTPGELATVREVLGRAGGRPSGGA